jgi:hypothetical protein
MQRYEKCIKSCKIVTFGNYIFPLEEPATLQEEGEGDIIRMYQ